MVSFSPILVSDASQGQCSIVWLSSLSFSLIPGSQPASFSLSMLQSLFASQIYHCPWHCTSIHCKRLLACFWPGASLLSFQKKRKTQESCAQEIEILGLLHGVEGGKGGRTNNLDPWEGFWMARFLREWQGGRVTENHLLPLLHF